MNKIACLLTFTTVSLFLMGGCSKEPTYVHPDAAPGEAVQKASPKPSTVPMNP